MNPYSLGLGEGYAAFERFGLEIPPDGGWAGTLVAFLGRDGVRAYLGLPDDAPGADVRTALAEYVRGCEDGQRDAAMDRATR